MIANIMAMSMVVVAVGASNLEFANANISVTNLIEVDEITCLSLLHGDWTLTASLKRDCFVSRKECKANVSGWDGTFEEGSSASYTRSEMVTQVSDAQGLCVWDKTPTPPTTEDGVIGGIVSLLILFCSCYGCYLRVKRCMGPKGREVIREEGAPLSESPYALLA